MLLVIPYLSFSQNDRIFVEEGDKIFDFGDYEDAILFYQLAIEENPKNIRANYMAGTCFLFTTSEKKEAVHYLLNAFELDEEVSNDILFKIAEGYRYRYEFDKAVNFYNEYVNEIQVNSRAFEGLDVEKLEKRAYRRIIECENAKKYVANPVDFKAKNVGGIVNSSAEDYAPTLNRSETTMYFTSRREGSTGGFKDTDNKYFEDIWIVEKVDGEWGVPQNMGDKINTNHHESNIGLSPDGNTLFIYHTENNGDIYYSEKKNGEWTEIKSMGKQINTEYQETSIYQSSNGSYMFFTSSRPGGQGGLDIYLLKKNNKGKWSKPENIGDVVNTQYSEEGPYFHVQTSTLYFSSKGHAGMGGYDLYKTVWDTINDTWSNPENLGYPINSADDETFYTISGDGEHAYYASFKDDSYGYLDIYMIIPLVDEVADIEPEDVIEVPVEVVVEKVIFSSVSVSVIVKDRVSESVINRNTINVYLDNNKDVNVYTGANIHSYNFNIVDSLGHQYVLMVEAQGYGFKSISFDIQPSGEAQSKEFVVYMDKQEKFVPIVLKNIYFSFDNFTLQSNSSIE